MSIRRIVVPCRDDPSKARTLGTQAWGGTPGNPWVGGPPGGPWGREGGQGRLRRPWGPWGLFRSHSEWMAIPTGSLGRRPKCAQVDFSRKAPKMSPSKFLRWRAGKAPKMAPSKFTSEVPEWLEEEPEDRRIWEGAQNSPK